MRRIALALTALLCWIGGFHILFGEPSTAADWRLYLDSGGWRTVRGEVTSRTVSRLREFSPPPEYRFVVHYRYEVEGASYSSDRYYIDGTSLRVMQPDIPKYTAAFRDGTSILIDYRRESPGFSVIDRRATRSMTARAIGGLIGILLGAFLLFAAVRASSPSRPSIVVDPQMGSKETGPGTFLVPTLAEEQRIAIAKSIEREAATNPRLFRLRLFGLGLLGHAVVAGFVLTCVVACALVDFLCFAAKTYCFILHATVIFGVALFVVVRALCFRLPATEGVLLSKSDWPDLHEEVERLRRAVGAPRIHRIYALRVFNARASQTPRLGPFGFYSNEVALGLPLLFGLSRDEFCAVLAHELGHISARHSRFGRRVYRTRLTWLRLASQLSRQRTFGWRLFVPFYRWFAVRYALRALVIARQFERCADEAAYAVVGGRIGVDALVRTALQAHRLDDEFWPTLDVTAKRTENPPSDVFDAMRQFLARPFDLASASKTLGELLETTPTPDDTHPALRDRVEAAAAEPRVPPPFERSAAIEILGDRVEKLIKVFNAEWCEAISQSWRERAAAYGKQKEQLDLLEQKGDARTIDESLERALLLESTEGVRSSLPVLRTLVEERPDHAVAHFELARTAFECGEPDAERLLEDVTNRHRNFALLTCPLLVRSCRRRGDSKAADAWGRRLRDESIEDELANAERLRITGGSGRNLFVPHDLSADTIARIQNELSRFPEIAKAFVMKRLLTHRPEREQYVFALATKPGFANILRSTRRNRDHALLALVARQAQLPESILVVLNSIPAQIHKELLAIAKTPFFERVT